MTVRTTEEELYRLLSNKRISDFADWWELDIADLLALVPQLAAKHAGKSRGFLHRVLKAELWRIVKIRYPVTSADRKETRRLLEQLASSSPDGFMAEALPLGWIDDQHKDALIRRYFLGIRPDEAGRKRLSRAVDALTRERLYPHQSPILFTDLDLFADLDEDDLHTGRVRQPWQQWDSPWLRFGAVRILMTDTEAIRFLAVEDAVTEFRLTYRRPGAHWPHRVNGVDGDALPAKLRRHWP